MPRPADRRVKIELLRAAEAVFVEHGLSAAKVEDITARAGVSKGAFYLHFESKEDCFRQIVEAFIAKLAACLDVGPPGEATACCPEAIQASVEQLAVWHAHDVEIFEFCWQNRGLMRMILAGGGGAPYAYLVDEFAERVARHIDAWARHNLAAGVYRPDVDPSAAASLIAGGYERLVREMVKQPRRPDLEALAGQAQALFIRGLFSEAARAVLDRKVSTPAPASGPAVVARAEAGAAEGRAGAGRSTKPRRVRAR